MESRPLTGLERAKMRALRNGIYHTIRRSHYERIDRCLMFLIIMLGTGVMASVADAFYLGTATAVLGSIQLVWAPGSRARDHAVLQGKFYALLAQSENARRIDPEELAVQIEDELARLYSDETTTMHAVNALAYNAAQLANGRPPEYSLEISWGARLFANIIPFSADKFKPTMSA